MTDHERRIVLRGMSVASGLLVATDCTHRDLITAYQKTLAEAWDIDENDPEHLREFKEMLRDVTAAIAAKYPEAVKPPKGD
jgi:uncharacterized coiled-coil protein SlyX